MSTSWSQDQENLVLNNVSFKVDKVSGYIIIMITVFLLKFNFLAPLISLNSF